MRPYRPQTISAIARRYRPQQKTISATQKINIGHIGQNHIGHKDIGHKIIKSNLFQATTIIIITDLYSAFRSEDTEALDAARGGLSEIEKNDEFTYKPVYIHFTCNELLSQRS